MRKIKVKNWKETDAEGKELESNILRVLGYCISKSIELDKLSGWDKTRMINAIEKKFKKAEKSKILELEDTHYAFIKKAVEKYSHPGWGANEKINNALERFMEAKEGEE